MQARKGLSLRLSDNSMTIYKVESNFKMNDLLRYTFSLQIKPSVSSKYNGTYADGVLLFRFFKDTVKLKQTQNQNVFSFSQQGWVC